MSTREEAKIHGDLRIEAEAVLELVSDGLEKAGVQSSIDYTQQQRNPGDDVVLPIDLDDKEAATKAIIAITAKADSMPIIFSRLGTAKDAAFCTNLHNKNQTIVACVLRAYNPREMKIVRQLNFLFKVVDPSGLNGQAIAESAVSAPEPGPKE